MRSSKRCCSMQCEKERLKIERRKKKNPSPRCFLCNREMEIQQKFCSSRCREKYRQIYALGKAESVSPSICKGCGKEFRGRPQQKYHSEKCRRGSQRAWQELERVLMRREKHLVVRLEQFHVDDDGVCSECKHEWPCATFQILSEWKKVNKQ